MNPMETLQTDRDYSLDELATLSAVPRRTIRYYIQLGLLDRPVGETRAAHYTWKHLRQLLEIRRLTEEGYSLDRIGELMRHAETATRHTAPSPVSGSVRVQSHVYLSPGLELVIDPGQASLTPAQLRHLAREILAAYERTTHKDSPS